MSGSTGESVGLAKGDLPAGNASGDLPAGNTGKRPASDDPKSLPAARRTPTFYPSNVILFTQRRQNEVCLEVAHNINQTERLNPDDLRNGQYSGYFNYHPCPPRTLAELDDAAHRWPMDALEVIICQEQGREHHISSWRVLRDGPLYPDEIPFFVVTVSVSMVPNATWEQRYPHYFAIRRFKTSPDICTWVVLDSIHPEEEEAEMFHPYTVTSGSLRNFLFGAEEVFGHRHVLDHVRRRFRWVNDSDVVILHYPMFFGYRMDYHVTVEQQEVIYQTIHRLSYPNWNVETGMKNRYVISDLPSWTDPDL
jgi:hypothetical protein